MIDCKCPLFIGGAGLNGFEELEALIELPMYLEGRAVVLAIRSLGAIAIPVAAEVLDCAVAVDARAG